MSYRNPRIIQNRTPEALASVTDKVGKSAFDYITSVKNKEKLEKLQKNKANEDLYNLSTSVNKIPTADDQKFDANFRVMLEDRMDQLYDLGKKVAAGEDNTEYLRLKAETEALAESIPDLITSINFNANALDKGIDDGNVLLQNQDARFLDFLRDWNEKDGAGATPKIVGGKLILDYKGYTVNTNAVLDKTERGGGVEFVEDPMKELKTIFETAGGDDYELYSKLYSSTKQEGLDLITSKTKSFKEANKRIASYFEIDDNKIGTVEDPLEDELTQNNYQFFIENEVLSSDANKLKEQKKALREAIVDRMMKDFAYDDIVNKGSTQTLKTKEKGNNETSETSSSKYLNKLNKEATTITSLVKPITNENSAKELRNKFSIPEDKFDSSNSDEYFAMEQFVDFAKFRTRVSSFEVKYDKDANMFRVYQKEDDKPIAIDFKSTEDVRNMLNSITSKDDERRVDLTEIKPVFD
tara:strand:- start:4660 stop:6063 length:1404 start_codon:yes stop_codon:yes gene_type:complete